MAVLEVPILEWLQALARTLLGMLYEARVPVIVGVLLLFLEYRTRWFARWVERQRDHAASDPGLDLAVDGCSVRLDGWLSSAEGHYAFGPKSALRLVIKLDASIRHDQVTHVEFGVQALETDWHIYQYAVVERADVQVTYQVPGIVKHAGNPLSLAPREIAKYLRIDASIPLAIPEERACDFALLGGLSTMTVVLAAKQAGRETVLCRIPCDVVSALLSVERALAEAAFQCCGQATGRNREIAVETLLRIFGLLKALHGVRTSGGGP